MSLQLDWVEGLFEALICGAIGLYQKRGL